MLADNTKKYLKITLGSSPKVLAELLKNAQPDDYDRVVVPGRFTLREMLAHIGDWESIFLGRLIKLRDDSDPVLQGIDEGQWSVDHDHSHADPVKSLHDYTVGRLKLIDFINQLDPSDWGKSGTHTELGRIDIEGLLILISVHDGYHLNQTIDWLKR